MQQKCLMLILMSVLCLSACTGRHHLENGIASFQTGNYRDAFIFLKPEAHAGNADAEYAVGYMYYYGVGVVEDKNQAWYWIKRAAEKRQPDAVNALKILNAGSFPEVSP